MRLPLIVLLVTAALVDAGAAAADDRFGADNPTFGQFESTCRIHNTMNDLCKGSVLGAFAAHSHTTPNKVRCNVGTFRADADRAAGRVVSVLPWQSVVESLVEYPGVCRTTAGLGR